MQLYMDIDGVAFAISVTGYTPRNLEDLKVYARTDIEFDSISEEVDL